MGTESDIRKTRELYHEMRSFLILPSASCDRVVARISAWSPLQQVAHVSKANEWILSSVVAIAEGSKDFEETGPTRPVGRLILRTGIIPRGIGKAPSVAMPNDNISLDRLDEDLNRQIDSIRLVESRIDDIKGSRKTFAHPYFGHFTSRQWMRFVNVHTHHHVKIVREILAAGDL